MLQKRCCSIHACSLFGQNVYLRTQRFGVTVVSSYDPGIAHVLHVSPSLHSTHPLGHAKKRQNCITIASILSIR